VAEPTLRPPPDHLVLTGATGWLGQALLHAVAVEGGRHVGVSTVRVLVRSKEEAEVVVALAPLIEADVEIVIGDVADADDVARLFARLPASVDVVHAAGVIHPQRVDEFTRVNATGTRNVAEAASRAGVRRLVHVSSNSPFGTNADRLDTFRADEPFHPYLGYGRSKMEAELAVRAAIDEAALDAVIVRPPWFYGPYQPARQTSFFRMIRKGRFPLLGGGINRRSMVYVDNLVDGVLLASRVEHAAGRAYWIADARPYPVHEIVTTVEHALQAEGLDVKGGSPKVPNVVGDLAERADRLLQGRGRYQQALHVLGEMNKTIACDITAACDELGYEPAIELAEGMRRSIRWCLEQGLEL
jgi:nucleoside-diphosphate-sugar epimerase